MRVPFHQVAILERSGLRLIGIDREIVRRLLFLGDERPLLPRAKPRAAAAAQTGVAFSAGYLAGILCAIVSHPADVMVSKLNSVRKPGEGSGAAIGRIYKDIGFSGLWNGLPVR